MFFPVFIDLSEKNILVVGGGSVAGRRVRVLCGFCEQITVVAPEISPEIAASGATVCRRKFEPSDLDGRQIVLAATDDAELNHRIAGLCRARGIPVNDCSDQKLCDFQFPSIVRDGDVVIGINASGKNHRLVKETRQRIERRLGVVNDCARTAILTVSVGTGYEETRRKTIDRIEQEIQEAYPDCRVYRAWTSGVIRRKLLERDGIRIPDVRGAMEQMHRDGIRTVIVQPTHVLNGTENDRMLQDVRAQENQFAQVVTGDPLLTSREDFSRVAQAVADRFPLEKNEALVLMGHGTEHYADAAYAALDYQFRDMGYPNICMGTVEGYPTVESVLRRIKKADPEKVILAPFMIVAGDHAANDLAGDAQTSWKNLFARAGYQVECVLEGLGEYDEVRKLFVEHVGASMKKLTEKCVTEK